MEVSRQTNKTNKDTSKHTIIRLEFGGSTTCEVQQGSSKTQDGEVFELLIFSSRHCAGGFS